MVKEYIKKKLTRMTMRWLMYEMGFTKKINRKKSVPMVTLLRIGGDGFDNVFIVYHHVRRIIRNGYLYRIGF